MPLLPEGEKAYKALEGQPAISQRSIADLRGTVLSQQEANWGTVKPDSLKVWPLVLQSLSFDAPLPLASCPEKATYSNTEHVVYS